jgi:hypothetical protein
MTRDVWLALTEDELLRQCEVDTYRASGPGGQKRNKTSSAVRLRHLPSGLIVIAEESRSQHENKAKALKRMHQAFALKLRDGAPDGVPASITAAKNADGRLEVGRKDPRFWPAAAAALDMLDSHKGRVHDAAVAVGVSTGNLIDFLQTDPKVWGEANALRQRHGQKPLRAE